MTASNRPTEFSPKPLRGNRCECSVCLLRFGGTRAFDRHRVGRHGARRCLEPGELLALGLHDTPGGWATSYSTARSNGERGKAGLAA